MVIGGIREADQVAAGLGHGEVPVLAAFSGSRLDGRVAEGERLV
jgi:hypothetical protein